MGLVSVAVVQSLDCVVLGPRLASSMVQSPWTVTSLAMGLNIEYLNKEFTYNIIY